MKGGSMFLRQTFAGLSPSPVRSPLSATLRSPLSATSVTRRRLFETLESRRVLCQNNLVPGELLEITGDSGANTIEVRDAGPGGVSVMCDGSVLVERALVDRVVVRSLGGSDTINYHLLGGSDRGANLPGDATALL